MKICLIGSSGGHLTQLLEMDNVYKNFESFFVTFPFNSDNSSFKKKQSEKFYYVINPHRSFIFFLYCFYQSLKIYVFEKPEVILTTGAGVALPMVLISKFFGKKIIFIESFSRAESPSFFGKLVYPIANLTVVQWKSLLRYYPKGIYGGPIFNLQKNIPSSKKTKGIFVTLGSRKDNLDRLLKELDQLVSKKLIKEKVFAQIGNTDYEPKNFPFFRFCPRDDFNKYINNCKIVLTHAGAGTIINSVLCGKKTIVVPRNPIFGECPDNHQYEIANYFYNNNFALRVDDISTLGKVITSSDNFIPSQLKMKSQISGIINSKIREWH